MRPGRCRGRPPTRWCHRWWSPRCRHRWWLSDRPVWVWPWAGERPGDFLRAYVAATIPEHPDTQGGGPIDRITAALLAGVLVDPGGLAPRRERYAAWQRRLAGDGVDPAIATVVRLAVDGWWAARLLGLAEPGRGLHEQVRQRLLEMIDDGAR